VTSQVSRETRATLYHLYKSWCRDQGLNPSDDANMVAFLRDVFQQDPPNNSGVNMEEINLSSQANAEELAKLTPREITLVVDDDCAVVEVARALASKYMTVQWTGVPGHGRIVLTEQGLALKKQNLWAGEDARLRMLEKGMER
jgi:hypothetical protein